jgi:hypothetical protein
MAGFVTWLRRQAEREDSVGVLSRDLVREDPARELLTLEDFRERMIEDGTDEVRLDALAQAVVEWGAGMGISVRARSANGNNILAPGYEAAADAGADGSVVQRQPVEIPAEERHPDSGQRTFVPALTVRGRDANRDGGSVRPWHEREDKPGAQPLPDPWRSL